jgi:hypothetical protein
MSINSPNRFPYQVVAATSTTTWGVAGAYIHRVIVNVASNTEATATLTDGSTVLVAIPATQAAGCYSIELNVSTSGAITAACSGNSNMRVVGLFTTAN